MRSIQVSTAAVLALLAIVAATVGISSIAFAAIAGPTVLLSSTSATSTNAVSIPVTAVFSESVNGFSSSSVQVTNATLTNFAGSGANYSFSVDPTADGVVTVQIAADVASSSATSTGNQVSNMLSFVSDKSAPIIAQITGIASTTTNATPSFTFSSNEAGTVNLTGGCVSPTNSVAVGSTTITFSALTNGSYSCTLSIADAASNVSNVLPIDFIVMSAATPTATSTMPVISNVTVTTSGTTTATITWMTDTSASSQVLYGTSVAYGSTSALNASSTTAHSVILNNLAEATLYHFEVVSSNAGGTATSSDQVFTAGSSASITPLAVTGIDSVNTTATADGTFANGFKWVLHLVVPSDETFFHLKFADFTTPSSSSTISIANNLRYYSPQSSNAMTNASAILESSNAYGGALLLTGDTSLSTPGRQIDVTIEAAVPVGTPIGSYSTIFGALSTTTP